MYALRVRVGGTYLLRDEVLSKLSELNIGYRVGIAGSVGRNRYNKRSDIDIVVDTDSLTIEEIKRIKEHLSCFQRKVDVLQLVLLKEEDLELDAFCRELDLPVNEDSVYKTVSREVIWCDSK